MRKPFKLVSLLMANVLLFGSLLMSGVGAAPSHPSLPDEAGGEAVVSQGERVEIRLQRATFDPLFESPQLPPELTREAYAGDETGYYLVQFRGPILADWRADLEGAGAVVMDYVPQFAYIVRMDETAVSQVTSQTAVRWVGIYQPAFRLSRELDLAIEDGAPGETTRLVVRSFAGEPARTMRAQFQSLGAMVREAGADTGGGTIFKLEVPASAVPELAQLNGVAWVEPWRDLTLTNAIARSSLAMNKDAVEAELGLYGAGQIVVVGDTGVSTGDAGTMHPDFQGHFHKGTWGSGTCGSWEDYYGHGTHVAGSVLGSGVMDGADVATHSYAGTNAGIAPEASLWAWAFCSDWTGLSDVDPYNDYYGVMYYDNPRVRINTNSWGYTTGQGGYNTFSRETDRFIWDHQDMVVVFSAGNAGTDANSDGIVDDDSINMPAGSKNILTVGASENYRLTGGYNPGGACSTYGSCWPGDYPADPVASDRLSDDTSGMVAFSSRGPVNDGRLRPDIVTPGSNIVSTRHASGSADPLWGVYDDWYSYCGGTSMAAPLAAGGTAIVREYYTVTHNIDPSAALVKATVINGAYDMTPGQYRDEVPSGSQDDVIRRPDENQGWGRMDLYNTLVHEPPYGLWFYEDPAGLNTGDSYVTNVTVSGSDHPFRVTLAWSDYPGTEATDGALVNDLDLEILAPDGTVYYGNDVMGDGLLDGDVDHVNNVEGIDVNPQPGTYVITVSGYNVPQGPQPFALVASGDMGYVGYLDGTVYDGTLGGTLEGASVQAVTGTVQYRMETDATGYYTMPVATDTYTLTAWKYGYTMDSVGGVTVVSDTVHTESFTLTRTALHSLSGCVTDGVTGDPLSATVTVQGPFGDVITETTAPQATGCYTLSIRGGSYTVSAAARLHEDEEAAVTVAADTVQDFGLRATTTDGILWGRVTSLATGNPVAGARVEAAPGGEWTETDVDGRYELQTGSGPATVTVSAPLYSSVDTGVVVPQSNLLELNVALPTAHMALLPSGGLGVQLYQGDMVTETLVISNSGLGGLDFEIGERNEGFTPLAAKAGANVLVVNDDYSSDPVDAVEDALTALGYTYDEVDETTFVGMTVGELLDYDGVIYIHYPDEGAEEDQCMAYLDAGGSLLVTDNDFGYSRNGSLIYDTYFQANYVSDDGSEGMITGQDIMDGIVVDIGSDPYPDDFTARAEGVGIFQAPSGNLAGLRVEREGYRAIYLGWDYDNIGVLGPGDPGEVEVMERALDWLVAGGIEWLSEDVINGTVGAGTAMSVTLTFDASVVTETGLYQGWLRVETNDPEAQPYAEYSVEMEVLPPPPVLGLAKSASTDVVEAGTDLEYAIVVMNAGGPATGVALTETLPAEVTYQWASDGGSLEDGDLVWRGLSVPAGGAVTVTYGVMAGCVPSGTEIVNDAYRVSAQEWPTPTLGAPVTVAVETRGVSAAFSYDGPVIKGYPETFTSQTENVTDWLWAFGDGETATEAHPAHTYGSVGPYTVVLTASNGCAQAVVSDVVEVETYALGAVVEPLEAWGDPGEALTYTMRLTNTGTMWDRIALSAVSDGWDAVLSADQVELSPGEGMPVVLTVTVPTGEDGGATNGVMVLGRSMMDPRTPAAKVEMELLAGLNEVYGVALGAPISTQEGAAGETVRYTVRVTNTSNVLDTMTFTVHGNAWTAVPLPGSMAIASQGWREIAVDVTIPLTAAGGSTDTVVLRATGSGGYDEVLLTTTAAWRTVYLPLVVR